MTKYEIYLELDNDIIMLSRQDRWGVVVCYSFEKDCEDEEIGVGVCALHTIGETQHLGDRTADIYPIAYIRDGELVCERKFSRDLIPAWVPVLFLGAALGYSGKAEVEEKSHDE